MKKNLRVSYLRVAISISSYLRRFPCRESRFGETLGPCHRRANRDRVSNVSPTRLTLYCGRIYEIRGDGIPPFTYAWTFSGSVADSICELVGFIGLPLLCSLSCRDSYLRHASSTNRRPGQNVTFCFLPTRNSLATHYTYTRTDRQQSIPMFLKSHNTYNKIGVFVLLSRCTPEGGFDKKSIFASIFAILLNLL